MSTTIVLTLGPENHFSRSKLQFMPSYKKQIVNNLLDKIETIYVKLLPGKSKVIWMVYFLLLGLFLLSGVVKNLSRSGENPAATSVSQRADNTRRHLRLLQQPAHPAVSQVPASSSNSSQAGTPMAASDMNMHLEEGPAPDYYSSALSKIETSLVHDLRKGMYFILEVFFIFFPFYYLWSRYRRRAFVLSLVKDLVDIENRQLITNCQFRAEITELSVITIVQFDSEGYPTDLDRSTTKLVLEKRPPSKKGAIQYFTPVVTI